MATRHTVPGSSGPIKSVVRRTNCPGPTVPAGCAGSIVIVTQHQELKPGPRYYGEWRPGNCVDGTPRSGDLAVLRLHSPLGIHKPAYR
jgi:hypothetical protein